MLVLRFPSFPLAGFGIHHHFPCFPRHPGAAPKDEGMAAVLPPRCLSWGGFPPCQGAKSIPSELDHSKMMFNVSCQVQPLALPCPWLSQQSLACPKLRFKPARDNHLAVASLSASSGLLEHTSFSVPPGSAFQCPIMSQGHGGSRSLLGCPAKKLSHKNYLYFFFLSHLTTACAEPELLSLSV